jgi:HAMP domain-containing protein
VAVSQTPPPRPRRRLWRKLALVLLGIGVLPLFFAAYLIADGDARRIAESARAYHLATAEIALGETRGLVARALAEARALGAILARTGQPAERREAAARAQLLGAELIDDVAVYDRTGERLLVMRSSGGTRWTPPESLAPAVRDEVVRLGQRVGERDVTGAIGLELVLPIRTGEGEAPGELYAFLAAFVDLSPLSALVRDLGTRHFADARRVRLLDERLRVIAAADPALLGTSLAGSPVVADVSGAAPFSRDVAYTVDYADAEGELIGAIVPLPELGWAALVEEPQEDAYAAVAATWRTAALVGVVVALVALLLALLLGRRLARPIEAMAEATTRVAHGDFEVRVPVVGRDEIATTARAFNYMASDLAGYRESLVAETRARDNLSRFLSPEVVERIVKGQEALALGGERRELTVLFADVRSWRWRS